MLIIILTGVVAGWLINLIADVVPERKSVVQYWYVPLHQLPNSIGQRLGLSQAAIMPQRRFRYVAVWLLAVSVAIVAYLNADSPARVAALSVYGWYLLVIAVIDFEHQLVLNRVLLVSLPFVVVSNLMLGTPTLLSMAVGGLIGFILFLLIALVQPGAMGMGDVKFAGWIGFAVGFPAVLMALLIGIMAGGLVALAFLFVNGFKAGRSIAYAPYLAAGAWLAMIYSVQSISSFPLVH